MSPPSAWTCERNMSHQLAPLALSTCGAAAATPGEAPPPALRPSTAPRNRLASSFFILPHSSSMSSSSRPVISAGFAAPRSRMAARASGVVIA